MTSPSLATQLARWVSGWDISSIPLEDLERAKLSLLDSIGCAFASLSERTVQNALHVIQDLDGVQECTVIGTARRTSSINAVLANGILIRAQDFSDHLPNDPNDGTRLGGHPSDCISVALALGQLYKRSGQDLLVAMVMGYEMFGRLQKLLSRDLPWDHVTALGLVSPAVAGRLLGLAEQRLANALALGAAHCATLGVVRRGEISAAKYLAGPLVAQAGTLATLLAARDVTGPLSVFEDERGLARGVMPEKDLSILTAPVQGKLMIEGVTIKAYPSLDTGLAAIAAALKVRQALKVPLSEIEKIELLMMDHPVVRRQIAEGERRHPTSRELADHSFHFLVAVALADGEVTPRQFEKERWLDPNICALMDRIVIGTDQTWNQRAPDGFPCTIRLIARGQVEQVAEVDYPPGHPKNPLSRTQVIEKFHGCTKSVLPEPRRKEIVTAVMSLEQCSSINDLMGMLTAS